MNILPSILRKLRYKPYHMFCSVKLLLLLLLSYFTPFLRGFCDPAFQGLYAYQVCGCHADTNLKLKIFNFQSFSSIRHHICSFILELIILPSGSLPAEINKSISVVRRNNNISRFNCQLIFTYPMVHSCLTKTYIAIFNIPHYSSLRVIASAVDVRAKA